MLITNVQYFKVIQFWIFFLIIQSFCVIKLLKSGVCFSVRFTQRIMVKAQQRFSLLSHERRLSQQFLHWPPLLLLSTRNGALIMKG